MGYSAYEVALGGTLGPRSCDRKQGWAGVCLVNEEVPPTHPICGMLENYFMEESGTW